MKSFKDGEIQNIFGEKKQENYVTVDAARINK